MQSPMLVATSENQRTVDDMRLRRRARRALIDQQILTPAQADQLLIQSPLAFSLEAVDKAAAAVSDLLAAFGIDEGEHTANTPQRVAKAWAHLLAGYEENPADHLEATFPTPHKPGPVIEAGIRLNSVCAHHMLPFTGTATVAYQPAPGQRIVGLSKLSRVTKGYARRLQVQEQIGAQVADAVNDRLQPAWVCVLITATHQCMTLRGVEDPNAVTTTRTLRGAMIPDADLALIAEAHRGGSR